MIISSTFRSYLVSIEKLDNPTFSHTGLDAFQMDRRTIVAASILQGPKIFSVQVTQAAVLVLQLTSVGHWSQEAAWTVPDEFGNRDIVAASIKEGTIILASASKRVHILSLTNGDLREIMYVFLLSN